MRNVIGKMAVIEKRIIVSWLLVVSCILLLSSCGPHAVVDRWQSKLNGDIDKQETVTAHELRKILIDHFGTTSIVFTGDEYILPDNGKVSDIQSDKFGFCNAQASKVLRPKDWDCEDFATAAKVPMNKYAFGTMYVTTTSGRKHVLNVFVNRKHEVWYWEPQTCRYYYDRFYAPPHRIVL